MEIVFKYAIEQWPGISSYLMLFAMIIAFIAGPIAVLLIISKLMNKDRYIFASNDSHLYRLDIATGKIHLARGRGFFQEMEIVDRGRLATSTPADPS